MRLLSAAVFALIATQVMGQGNCGPRDAVLAGLADKYGETRQSMGLGGGGGLMEIFANLETGTWTATITSAQGLMCFVASGREYQQVDEEPPTGEPI